jgi:hypothetical protein
MKQIIIKYQVIDKDGLITSEENIVVEATENNLVILQELIKYQIK